MTDEEFRGKIKRYANPLYVDYFTYEGLSPGNRLKKVREAEDELVRLYSDAKQAGYRAGLEEAKAALLSNKRLYVDPSATYHFKEWLNAKLKEQP